MNLLNEVLREPTVVRGWGTAEWNRFLPLARNAGLLGRCRYLFEQHGLDARVPARLLDQLRGALAQTRYLQVQALRELRQVVRTLGQAEVEVVALKGVAYLAGELPPHAWRSLSDIDILVPADALGRAEQALLRAGWVTAGAFDAYDQHYYRDWMHEVPPLVHRGRTTEVDLHHNLSPPVSRVRIDARLLWDQAVPVTDRNGVSVSLLGPADMLIHNAVHLFMNDELRGGLRDVMDFRDLYEHFTATRPGFAEQLLARAAQLGCKRPLYYAVSTAQRLTGLRTDAVVRERIAAWRPVAPLDRLMRWLIDQVLAPRRLGLRRSAVAERLLFVRSHWVRMPTGMLIRHLLHKVRVRGRPPQHDAEMPG